LSTTAELVANYELGLGHLMIWPPEHLGGWRLRWLTRPALRDPESGEGGEAMTGACLTVSQVQPIPWAAAPSSTSLLLVTSVFVTALGTRANAAKPCMSWVAAV